MALPAGQCELESPRRKGRSGGRRDTVAFVCPPENAAAHQWERRRGRRRRRRRRRWQHRRRRNFKCPACSPLAAVLQRRGGVLRADAALDRPWPIDRERPARALPTRSASDAVVPRTADTTPRAERVGLRARGVTTTALAAVRRAREMTVTAPEFERRRRVRKQSRRSNILATLPTQRQQGLHVPQRCTIMKTAGCQAQCCMNCSLPEIPIAMSCALCM